QATVQACGRRAHGEVALRANAAAPAAVDFHLAQMTIHAMGMGLRMLGIWLGVVFDCKTPAASSQLASHAGRLRLRAALAAACLSPLLLWLAPEPAGAASQLRYRPPAAGLFDCTRKPFVGGP